jgi:galactokinase
MITPFHVQSLDTAVDAALSAGALGARMVGGGFGGSAIALISAHEMDSVKQSIKQAFAGRSFKSPSLFHLAAKFWGQRALI